MSASWRRALLAASAVLVTLPAAGPGALAQDGRAWVDPPTGAIAAAPAAPAQPPAPAAPASPATSPNQNPAPMPSEARPNPAPSPPVQAAQPEPAPKPEPSTRSAQPQAPVPAEPPPGVADRRRGSELAARASAARELTRSYFDYWSSPNAETLAATPEFYGANVIFHGRAMSIRELLQEKRRFVQRWPERRYRLRPDTMGVSCDPGGRSCTVRSVFDFAASNPAQGRHSQGIATIELVVGFAGDRPVITAESSLVHGRGASRVSLEDDSDE